jgi:hypothetical protein
MPGKDFGSLCGKTELEELKIFKPCKALDLNSAVIINLFNLVHINLTSLIDIMDLSPAIGIVTDAD